MQLGQVASSTGKCTVILQIGKECFSAEGGHFYSATRNVAHGTLIKTQYKFTKLPERLDEFAGNFSLLSSSSPVIQHQALIFPNPMRWGNRLLNNNDKQAT